MTTLREAAQQALDYIRSTTDYKMGHPPACEAALDLADALAEPQEPAAWNVIDPLGKVVATETNAVRGWARIGGYKPTVEGLLGFHEQGWRVVPATPQPRRQPLTDEEIDLVLQKSPIRADYGHLYNLCRAIEAAIWSKA